MVTIGNTSRPHLKIHFGFSCIVSVARKRGADPPAAIMMKAQSALITMPGMTQLTLIPDWPNLMSIGPTTVPMMTAVAVLENTLVRTMVSSTSTSTKTGNGMIDGQLSDKLRRAAENDIDMSVAVDLKGADSVSDMDLCTIFGNALDNALGAGGLSGTAAASFFVASFESARAGAGESFAVPDHPLVAARSERIEQQGISSFFNYSVPEAVLKFRQGFGRLIRTKDDKGIVVILDSRVVNKRYGQTFLASIPKCPTVYF